MRDTALILYSGEQCHLCDLALELIEQTTPYRIPDLQKVDIGGDHQLHHLYGARIPVLKRADTSEELGWPFDAQQLEAFLS